MINSTIYQLPVYAWVNFWRLFCFPSLFFPFWGSFTLFCFSSVQFSLSVMSDSLRPHESQQARPPCPSPTPGVYSNSSIESVMPSNQFILCHPLLLLPSIFPSIRVFSNESTLHMRWPKYWSFSFSISPSNEHPGLISSRMDLLDLLAVQGTLKRLLQHHSSKALILRCSAFFTVQLSHPYMTTGYRFLVIRLFQHIFLQNYSAFSPIKHTTLTFFGFEVFIAIKGRRDINMNKYQSVTLVIYLPLEKKFQPFM